MVTIDGGKVSILLGSNTVKIEANGSKIRVSNPKK